MSENFVLSEAAEFNRRARGKIWSDGGLPREWDGLIHLKSDDLQAFSLAVARFQREEGLEDVDGKLGRITLGALRRAYGPMHDEPLIEVGGALFFPSEEPNAPADKPAPRPGRSPEEKRAARLWNLYGAAIAEAAKRHDLPVSAALTVFSVESGRAYDQTGLVIIRVETPGRWPDGEADFADRYGEGQQAEWAALKDWAATDSRKAFKKASWGLGQVMGFNHRLVGYDDPVEMAQAFQRSCRAQVEAFFRYCDRCGLNRAIRAQDWPTVAEGYNGKGQVRRYSAFLTAAARAVAEVFG